MITPLSALRAFRQDVVSNADAATDDDGRWLQVVSLLQSATDVHPTDRGPIFNVIAELAASDVPVLANGDLSIGVTFGSPPPRLIALAIGSLIQMEDATRFHMSYATADALLRLIVAEVADDAVRRDLQGLLLVLQARIARQLGDLITAREHYEIAEELGKEHDSGATVARAWVGYGLLSLMRGNLPEARTWFHKVLDTDGAVRESVQVANQSLLVAASSAGEYDTGARHGWAAYELAFDDDDAAAALCDLSELMRVSGRPQLALRGFSAALTRAPAAPRRRFAALGGAAVAAAHAIPSGKALPIVAGYKAEIDALIESTRLPFMHATALADLGDAYAALGDGEMCEDSRARAKFIARAHGFFEVLFRVTDDAIPVVRRDVVPVHANVARAAGYGIDSASPVLSAIAAFAAPPEIEAALRA